MTKGKLIAFGVIFIIAILLIIIGAIFSKKDNTEVSEEPKSTYRSSFVPASKDNPFNGTADIPNQKTQTEGIDKIYDIVNNKDLEKQKEVELKHDGLRYTINMPEADLNDLAVKETRENYTVSTGFYYKATDGTEAMVFAITNYPVREWDKIDGSTDDVVIGKTPIRVLTYTLASDNPFTPDSEDSKKYLAYVEKVPQYVKKFDMFEE
ncbi:hypothetical protein CN918_25980 [Priestia megaterium]|nr:hypothetical protein CN918_25980 [Priestia megaterium]